MISNELIERFFVVLVLLILVDLANCECSRSYSRIVRNIYQQKVEPIFKDHELVPAMACPFNVENNIFGIQELYATGSANKWTCHLCGKFFFDVQYLDRHFDLKHRSHLLNGENVHCLADFCDWMRCDVVSGRVVSQFWDLALCNQATMGSLRARCMDTIELCIPKEVNATMHAYLLARFNQSLCAYLACDGYWDQNSNSDQMSSVKVVLVTLFSVFLLVALVGYYYVAFTYFLTDSYDPDISEHSEAGNVKFPTQNHLRYRQRAM